MAEKTHWKKVFNKDYLGACDLEDNKDLKAVIKKVEIEDVKDQNGKSSKCNVAIFDGNIKPMILNVTNCKVIKKFANSPYIDDWKNIPVQIYIRNDIKAFGEITEGLRIREVQPKIGKVELLPNTDQWTKAIEYLKSNGNLANIKARYEISPANEKQLLTLSKND